MREGRAGNQYKPGGKKGKRFTLTQRRILLKEYGRLERRMKFGQREIEGKLADKYEADIRTIQRNLKKARQEQDKALLRIQSPSVKLFNDGFWVARYATVEVAAVSKEATDCWAWVEVLPSGPSFPLHWAGSPLTPDEASAPRIVIRPEKPALLDVVLALPPAGRMPRPSGFARAEISGIVGHPSWDGAGCWLAQPAALYNPDPLLESYLAAGEYRIRVSVGCEGGEGDSRDFVLRSPALWEGLALTPVPGATHK